MQLGLDLAEQHLIPVQNLGDVRAELTGLRVDDLVLFLDSEGQGRRFHVRFSTTNVGTVDPPPAVTLSSAAVESRVRQPSTDSPWAMKGAVSSMRSSNLTLPCSRLGYGSDGSSIRSCTMYG